MRIFYWALLTRRGEIFLGTGGTLGEDTDPRT